MDNNQYKKYYGAGFDVWFYPSRCIHSARCISNLPAVFDVAKRPWINPDNGLESAIYEIIRSCPSGALQFVKNDKIVEDEENETVITMHDDGPLIIKGNLNITDSSGALLKTKRAALCRCGKTNNAPLCDLSCRR